jgi:hypothetical protein
MTFVIPAATPTPLITRVPEIPLLNAHKTVDVEIFMAAFATNLSGFVKEIFSVYNAVYSMQAVIGSFHTTKSELEGVQSRLENTLIMKHDRDAIITRLTTENEILLKVI